MTQNSSITWTDHDGSDGDQDVMSECGRFEGLMDETYGFYQIRRTDEDLGDEERARLSDDLICEVQYLSEAAPHIQRYLAGIPTGA